MKKIIGIIFSLTITVSVFCQIDTEQLMTRRYLSCQDIWFNAQFLIPEYYNSRSYDTLSAIIDYWEKHCGISEEIARCKILLSISQGDFNENVYDENIIQYLLTYKKNANFVDIGYGKMYIHYNWNYYNNQLDTLDKFTELIATELLQRDNLQPVEKFFLRIYSKDFDNTFASLNGEEFDGTRLQELYLKAIQKHNKKTTGHGDIMVGSWLPQDNLEIVGQHLFLGCRGGIRYDRFIADVTLGFKFGDSPNVYQVHKNDSVWDTDHFFGGYFGLDAGYNLINFKNSHIDLIGGIAYDGFDALKVDVPDSDDDITKSINSLNLNAGIGYKYYVNPFRYIGFDVKYNFVNYRNPNGTDLSGNAITINLIYGFLGNRYDINRLKELDYDQAAHNHKYK